MQAFRSLLCKLTNLRKERASAAKEIAEATRVGDGDAESIDDEHAEAAELNTLLDEIIDELGFELESSDEGPPL
jgi:hypothetical protein